MEELQRKGKALITFFGMVQFRMPLDTHSRYAQVGTVWHVLTSACPQAHQISSLDEFVSKNASSQRIIQLRSLRRIFFTRPAQRGAVVEDSRDGGTFSATCV